jgi:hypothetical protein
MDLPGKASVVKQLRLEMVAQQENIKKDSEEVQTKVIEPQEHIKEVVEKDTATIFKTDMEMLKKFHIESGTATPHKEMPGILSLIIPPEGEAGRLID